jgi:hypothetical protein
MCFDFLYNWNVLRNSAKYCHNLIPQPGRGYTISRPIRSQPVICNSQLFALYYCPHPQTHNEFAVWFYLQSQCRLADMVNYMISNILSLYLSIMRSHILNAQYTLKRMECLSSVVSWMVIKYVAQPDENKYNYTVHWVHNLSGNG